MGPRQCGAPKCCELKYSVSLRKFHLEIAVDAQSSNVHALNRSLSKCCIESSMLVQ